MTSAVTTRADRAVVDRAIAQSLPVLREGASEADRTGAFPAASLAALRHCGLMALIIPTEYGGLGGDLSDVAYSAQRLAGACLSTSLTWVMHCQQVDAIVRFGSLGLCDRLLPRLATEGGYIASVTAERATGGALLRAEEALVVSPDGIQFNRTAPVVTGGAHAYGYLIKLRSAPDASASDVSLLYAGRDQVDVQTGRGWDALGMRATENVGMTLRGVIPADQLVGGLGGFRRIVVEAFAAAAHTGWSACWLGAARSAFSALVREIRAGGRVRVDPGSDLTNHRIALIRCRLELVSAYLSCVLHEVTERRRRGESLEPPAVQAHLNTLKVLASRETFQAVDEMIGLAGISTGYLRTSPIALERLFRDLRAAGLIYDDTKLLVTNGNLTVLDPAVTLIGDLAANGGPEEANVD